MKEREGRDGTRAAAAAGEAGRLVEVCREVALGEGESVAVRVQGPVVESGPGREDARRIALFRWEGRIYALDDRCPHAGGPLSRGTLIEGAVMCSWHCATFDLESGESLDSISRRDADVYPVEVRDGRILVRMPVPEGGTGAPEEAAPAD